MLDTCNFDALPSNSHPSLLWTVPSLCGSKSRGKCAEGTDKDTNAVWKRHYLAPPKPLSISSSNYLNLSINQSKNDFVLPSHLDFQRLRKSFVCGRGRHSRARECNLSTAANPRQMFCFAAAASVVVLDCTLLLLPPPPPPFINR